MSEITMQQSDLGLHIDPDVMQEILDAFHQIGDKLKEMAEAIIKAVRAAAEWAAKTARRFIESIAAGVVPGKWLHLAKHAKKLRTRKKYRRRIWRALIAALAEGGGSS